MKMGWARLDVFQHVRSEMLMQPVGPGLPFRIRYLCNLQLEVVRRRRDIYHDALCNTTFASCKKSITLRKGCHLRENLRKSSHECVTPVCCAFSYVASSGDTM